MKTRSFIAVCFVCIVVVLAGIGSTEAKKEGDNSGAAIGIISVQKIFQDSKRNAAYGEKINAEQSELIAKLEALGKEIEADKAGLAALKTDSEDYLKLVQTILQKQGNLQAQQEFFKESMASKQKKWTETMYQDILKQTRVVAEEKGLDIVFEKTDPQLPAPNLNELTRAINVHKVIYSGSDCQDITDEVRAKLDDVK